MEYLTIYEAGVRCSSGEYRKFCESPKKSDVDEYIEIMKETVGEEFTIVYFEKKYELVSTIPHIIK